MNEANIITKNTQLIAKIDLIIQEYNEISKKLKLDRLIYNDKLVLLFDLNGEKMKPVEFTRQAQAQTEKDFINEVKSFLFDNLYLWRA